MRLSNLNTNAQIDGHQISVYEYVDDKVGTFKTIQILFVINNTIYDQHQQKILGTENWVAGLMCITAFHANTSMKCRTFGFSNATQQPGRRMSVSEAQRRRNADKRSILQYRYWHLIMLTQVNLLMSYQKVSKYVCRYASISALHESKRIEWLDTDSFVS